VNDPRIPLNDPRVVMTLDAGGTNFRFGALRGGAPAIDTIARPAESNDLDAALARIADGFEEARRRCPEPPVAISFAFPGPADYAAGIIVDPPNMPAFRGGVALGPMLEDRFGIPVFINNDGHLFAYGESIAGFLPYVNGLLERANRRKRFRTLLGVTLGTGFGGGFAFDGELHVGDHGVAAEVWRLRNTRHPEMNAEEGASARAVCREYAIEAGLAFEQSPDASIVFEVAMGRREGDRASALTAFGRLGEVVGDAIAQACALVDGLVVIGGGVSAAWPLFMPSLVARMNGATSGANGVGRFRRLAAVAFNLEDPEQLRRFLEDRSSEIVVPGSGRRVFHDPVPRTGIGVSRLGTSEAIALGAYVFAIRRLRADTAGRS
jgi:glucokinase